MKSMTGYAKACFENDTIAVNIEISSVNGRNLDVNVRAPYSLMFLEHTVRNVIASRLNRGSVKVLLKVDIKKPSADFSESFRVRVREALNIINIISEEAGGLSLSASDVLRFPDLLNSSDMQDTEEIEKAVAAACEDAVKRLNEEREKEGQQLKNDLCARIDEIEKYAEELERLAPLVTDEYRQKLSERVTQILSEPADEKRVEEEVTFFADRCDITEEIVRIKSHVIKFHELVKSPEPVGKHLNFLVQEFHREFNTVGSKSRDINISNLSVAGKCEIEKIREQIQNIE